MPGLASARSRQLAPGRFRSRIHPRQAPLPGEPQDPASSAALYPRQPRSGAKMSVSTVSFWREVSGIISFRLLSPAPGHPGHGPDSCANKERDQHHDDGAQDLLQFHPSAISCQLPLLPCSISGELASQATGCRKCWRHSRGIESAPAASPPALMRPA